MSLVHFSYSFCSSSSNHPLFFPCVAFFRPISAIRKSIICSIPARDTVIDFGKYRGRMLGTLPSKYLRWVSKNLRARDFEEWAKRADEVLSDPVYADRLEWEFADNILHGDDSRISRIENPVSDLLEISKRFGWDNEDQCGWNRIDFDLLGTSMGARIPRLKDKLPGKKGSGFVSRDLGLSEREKDLGSPGRIPRLNCEKKMGFLRQNSGFPRRENLGFSIENSEDDDVRDRRETRRERQRLKREDELSGLQMQKLIKNKKGDELFLLEGRDKRASEMGNLNPFPGRGALLRKLNKA